MYKRQSLRLEDIQAFLNVVELGSISAAAERMSLSKSVISKRVSDLERHLGVRLLYRSTRNVEPTEAGGFFYKSAKASLQDLNNAAESVALRENDLCGELRVMAPMSFGTLWLGPLVMEFMARNPRLEVVLQDVYKRQAEECGYPRHPAAQPGAEERRAGGLLAAADRRRAERLSQALSEAQRTPHGGLPRACWRNWTNSFTFGERVAAREYMA